MNKSIKKLMTGAVLSIVLLDVGLATESYINKIESKTQIERIKSDKVENIKNFENERFIAQKIIYEEELKRKEQKSITVDIIKNYIIEVQPKVTETQAESYAKCIVNLAESKQLSPYYLAAIPRTETTYDKDAVHGLSYVHGLCGVSYKDWGKFLKDKDIIRTEKDLKNPYINIAAGAEIFAYYLKISDTPREAVKRYKGYCSEGAKRAAKVVEIAVMLKRQEREYSRLT